MCFFCSLHIFVFDRLLVYRYRMNQYDLMADKYEAWTQSTLRKYAWTETVTRNLANIKGKRVLDLACGTGKSTEILAKLGAKEIIGIDISEESLKIARKKNIPNTTYYCGNAFDFDFSLLGKFDMIVGIFLIEYTPDKQDIENLFRQLHEILIEDGDFLSLTIDPMVIEPNAIYYGIRQDIKPLVDGDKCIDQLCDSSQQLLIEVEMYYWSRKIIDQLLKKSGFTCKWLPVYVSSDAYKEFPYKYWDKFLKSPIYVMFSAKKLKT